MIMLGKTFDGYFFVQVAKVTTEKSKTILTDIEQWQKGVASTDVFGVPIEVTVQ
ncbi:unnamed protein product, partial [Vitis vinifera]|uniref:Uncharacterized protein n=1 Tax=Vitis vinifera TaxID=29760 RepID=D7T5N2_VITVI